MHSTTKGLHTQVGQANKTLSGRWGRQPVPYTVFPLIGEPQRGGCCAHLAGCTPGTREASPTSHAVDRGQHRAVEQRHSRRGLHARLAHQQE